MTTSTAGVRSDATSPAAPSRGMRLRLQLDIADSLEKKPPCSDDIVVCALAADPRIWPLKIVRLLSAYGHVTTGTLAGMYCTEAAEIGWRAYFIAGRFLEAIAQFDDESREEELLNRLARKELLPGYGVAHRRHDERADGTQELPRKERPDVWDLLATSDADRRTPRATEDQDQHGRCRGRRAHGPGLLGSAAPCPWAILGLSQLPGQRRRGRGTGSRSSSVASPPIRSTTARLHRGRARGLRAKTADTTKPGPADPGFLAARRAPT